MRMPVCPCTRESGKPCNGSMDEIAECNPSFGLPAPAGWVSKRCPPCYDLSLSPFMCSWGFLLPRPHVRLSRGVTMRTFGAIGAC
eukprot:1052598-Amphidinium_carterae.1